MRTNSQFSDNILREKTRDLHDQTLEIQKLMTEKVHQVLANEDKIEEAKKLFTARKISIQERASARIASYDNHAESIMKEIDAIITTEKGKYGSEFGNGGRKGGGESKVELEADSDGEAESA
jgi:hypothetical protein